MILETVIQALQQRCAAFNNNVGGAAEFKHLEEAANLQLPCAFVIPLDEDADEPMAQNAVRQRLVDAFAVIVAIDNTPNERGQTGVLGVRTVRAQIFKALLGWRPTADYNGIYYQSGSLLSMDRARLWYQFEFGAEMFLGPEDGYEGDYQIGLPHLDGVTIKVDAINPQHDPNLAAPGQPDGRIENTVPVPKTGILP